MKIIQLTRSEIPERLRTIPQPPKELHYIGELLPLLQRPCLAVVGSRKPTVYGRQVTEQLVSQLAGQGIVIISGLAFGIDSIAHRACLEAGGQTIAVLPGSLDKIYPVGHQRLAGQIVQQCGALLSEYASGTQATKYNFIYRNRLVSGLADGVLIIEAAEGSGTLHTAAHAREQHRQLMVVPGNITSPLSRVTNRMIKESAEPITCAEDVILALGLTPNRLAAAEVLGTTAEEVAIIKLLRQGISDGGELMQLSQLAPEVFNQTLTMMEITAKIRPLGAGHWRLY